jgi:hypothetical protein
MEEVLKTEQTAVAATDPEHGENESLREHDATAIPDSSIQTRWQVLANKLEMFTGAEARGIERVDESFRSGKNSLRDYFNMAVIWFSVNLTVIFKSRICLLSWC